MKKTLIALSIFALVGGTAFASFAIDQNNTTVEMTDGGKKDKKKKKCDKDCAKDCCTKEASAEKKACSKDASKSCCKKKKSDN